MHKYMHHIGDFNSATRFLSRLERSIYLDMMFMYYDTEKPLILDVDALCRKLAAHSGEEKEAVQYVLGEFFVRTDSGYFNARCDEVIREFYDSKSAKSAAGKASAAKREQDKQKRIAELNKQAADSEQAADSVCSGKQQDSTDVEQVLDSVPTDTQQNPTNLKPKTNNQYKKILSDPAGSNDVPPPKSSSQKIKPEQLAAFEKFYASYPRKVKKQEGQKAFAKIDLSKHPLETILTALERHKLTAQWQDKGFIPHPATWLNGQQWLDELDERDMQASQNQNKSGTPPQDRLPGAVYDEQGNFMFMR